VRDVDAPVIAVTSGEPAGIGPEICLALARPQVNARVVVIGDADLLVARGKALGFDVPVQPYDPAKPPSEPVLEVVHVPLRVPSVAGHLDPANAPYVLELLDRAIDGCRASEFGGMATAPVHKGVINDAGIPFTGHTEYLGERIAGSMPVMMLAGGGLRVALATTHLALKDVHRALTRDVLEDVIRVLHRDLFCWFGIDEPKILVAGLNPHAGESGHLGREEIKVIVPVLEILRGEGMDLVGPLPADTLFTPEHLRDADCVLAMYHDQGLPVLKYASFGRGVNITLGLPIVRTSVDHGTALDIVGTGRADPASLIEAIAMAALMARPRRRR